MSELSSLKNDYLGTENPLIVTNTEDWQKNVGQEKVKNNQENKRQDNHNNEIIVVLPESPKETKAKPKKANFMEEYLSLMDRLILFVILIRLFLLHLWRWLTSRVRNMLVAAFFLACLVVGVVSLVFWQSYILPQEQRNLSKSLEISLQSVVSKVSQLTKQSQEIDTIINQKTILEADTTKIQNLGKIVDDYEQAVDSLQNTDFVFDGLEEQTIKQLQLMANELHDFLFVFKDRLSLAQCLLQNAVLMNAVLIDLKKAQINLPATPSPVEYKAYIDTTQQLYESNLNNFDTLAGCADVLTRSKEGLEGLNPDAYKQLMSKKKEQLKQFISQLLALRNYLNQNERDKFNASLQSLEKDLDSFSSVWLLEGIDEIFKPLGDKINIQGSSLLSQSKDIQGYLRYKGL